MAARNLRKTAIFLAALSCLALTSCTDAGREAASLGATETSAAASEAPEASASPEPAEPEVFVFDEAKARAALPQGYIVSLLERGDMNGDGREDAIIVAYPDIDYSVASPRPSSEIYQNTPEYENSGFFVLLGQRDGSFAIAAQTNSIQIESYLTFSRIRILGGGFELLYSVEVEPFETKYLTFAYDAASGDFMLIQILLDRQRDGERSEFIAERDDLGERRFSEIFGVNGFRYVFTQHVYFKERTEGAHSVSYSYETLVLNDKAREEAANEIIRDSVEAIIQLLLASSSKSTITPLVSYYTPDIYSVRYRIEAAVGEKTTEYYLTANIDLQNVKLISLSELIAFADFESFFPAHDPPFPEEELRILYDFAGTPDICLDAGQSSVSFGLFPDGLALNISEGGRKNAPETFIIDKSEIRGVLNMNIWGYGRRQ